MEVPDELRERAVHEVRTSGRPVSHAVRDRGIHKEARSQWVRQAEAGQGERPDPPALTTRPRSRRPSCRLQDEFADVLATEERL
ncbi:transposase [Streptomyces populi]|uniref:transposase n=1 Tax=Streptomyces populi TaxID=2058924 RepID=UPI0035DA50BF